jgi:predicted Zn-dependent peptidase
MAMYLDEPQHQVQELLNATLWPDQPLGRPITGTPETLDRMRRKDLVGYLRSHYVTDSTLIVAAGKISHADALLAVRRYARHFIDGKSREAHPTQISQQRPRLALISKPTEQTQIALGIRTCSRHDERRYPLRLLNTILGENMSSRLFQVIREDRGLAYSVYSTPSFFEDAGDLVISAGLDTDKLERSLRLIVRELRGLAEVSPGLAELRRARDYVNGQIELGQESTDNQMNWIGEQWLGYGNILRPDQVKARLLKVTASEIRAVAREFFRPDRLNLAVVSPLKSVKHLTKLLCGV